MPLDGSHEGRGTGWTGWLGGGSAFGRVCPSGNPTGSVTLMPKGPDRSKVGISPLTLSFPLSRADGRSCLEGGRGSRYLEASVPPRDGAGLCSWQWGWVSLTGNGERQEINVSTTKGRYLAHTVCLSRCDLSAYRSRHLLPPPLSLTPRGWLFNRPASVIRPWSCLNKPVELWVWEDPFVGRGRGVWEVLRT